MTDIQKIEGGITTEQLAHLRALIAEGEASGIAGPFDIRKIIREARAEVSRRPAHA